MNFLKISSIFNLYESFDIFHEIHTRTVRKCDFNLLMEWFYPVLKKTILTAQYVDRSICRSHIDWWTGQYPIL